jgi:hypothetical protein
MTFDEILEQLARIGDDACPKLLDLQQAAIGKGGDLDCRQSFALDHAMSAAYSALNALRWLARYTSDSYSPETLSAIDVAAYKHDPAF